MKLTSLLTPILGLFTWTASAIPLEERTDQPVQTVRLTFHGGPASYNLTFPADGQLYKTNNDLSVSIIEAPDYAAFTFCRFETYNEATLVSSISPAGINQILVGPPTPITGVRCEGFCVDTWSECYRNGQFVGLCCQGYCAANRCRPWVYP
ncbi:hypothetical protein VTJ04DRAFT_5713 [Mycothermus thermophilus]|uniref:uncharacterized protein n=1 Tax=Humicola insolens TaxID=85995 RepID=UPI0037437C65